MAKSFDKDDKFYKDVKLEDIKDYILELEAVSDLVKQDSSGWKDSLFAYVVIDGQRQAVRT